ncbi:MAG: lyase family protein [Burkholderiaceae bacterium]
MSANVFEAFLSTPEMLALVSDGAVVQAMMDFEAALARAQGRLGVIPPQAAQAIASLCRAELYDVPAMLAASGRAGSLAIPLVNKLTETVALFDPVSAGYVHWGSTSQDVIDSAMVLLTRRALRLLDDDLLALVGDLLELAEAQAATPLLARTLLQPAQVSSLRFRVLGWLMPLLRGVQQLRRAADEALLLQFGGAVGTLSSLGEQAEAVAAAVAAELRLPLPEMPWHTQRDRWVRLGAELGVLCGSLGKLAGDLALLGQAEVGELAEPVAGGRGGSSAMPNKRNPVACMQALAAARRAPQRVAALLACMGQEQERGLGGWQAELAEWSGLLLNAHGAVRAMAEAVRGLQLFPARMLCNIDAQQDLVFAEGLTQWLAQSLGRREARLRVDSLCARVLAGEGPLRQLARQQAGAMVPPLDGAALDAVFDVHRAAAQADARVRLALPEARRQWARLRADSPYPTFSSSSTSSSDATP